MAVAIGVPLLVYLAQDALIFQRQPLAEGRRAQLARQADVAQVWLTAADGTRVHAWHLKSGPTLVLYFGGNAEEVSWMLEAARAEAPGVSWFLLDYRGYGLSEGAPSQKALVADALMVYDHAAKLPGVDAGRMFAFGRSLGSGVAVALAAERRLAGLVLATPFDSLAAVAQRYYWFLPVRWMLKHPFDSLALAPRMDTPLLCLIAGRDEVIPPEHAERLFAAWRGPKRKEQLPHAGHNETDADARFWPAIRAFVEK
ncbi:MAG: lysophospholipase [Betaproteobacteria bacterium]|nr:lysophospholipase [Betaproteobacteria bacterium]MDH5350728.1 lysophospholipase [Betaproteobacteria bacterium]